MQKQDKSLLSYFEEEEDRFNMSFIHIHHNHAIIMNGKINHFFIQILVCITDYGRTVRKLPSLYGRKSTPNSKFLGTAKA